MCLILILFLVFVPVFFDLGRYKPELTSWLKARTGHDVDITGKIAWSLMPEASITIERLTVAGPPGFEGQLLLTLDHVEIAFARLPLFNWRLAIKRLLIDGCTLHLIQDRQGAGNWQLGAGSNQLSPAGQAATEGDSAKQWLSTLTALDELTVTRGQLFWENRQSGNKLAFKNIRFKIDKVLPGTHFNIALETEVSKPPSPLPAVIKLTTGLQNDSSGLRWLFDNSRLQMANTESLLPYNLPSLSVAAHQATFDWEQESLRVAKLQVDIPQVRLSSKDLTVTRIQTEPEIQASVEIVAFNPKALLLQLGIDPGKWAGDAMSTSAFNLQASQNRLAVNDLKLMLDNTQFEGWLSLENINHPTIEFNLLTDQLDLDRYLPPSDRVHAAGPGFGELSVDPLLKLPLDQLKVLSINGRLKIANIKLRGISMNDVNLQIRSDQGKLAVVQTTGIKQ